MIQKKKTEGEKPVAVCMVHGLESQPLILYFVSGSEPLGVLGKLTKV